MMNYQGDNFKKLGYKSTTKYNILSKQTAGKVLGQMALSFAPTKPFGELDETVFPNTAFTISKLIRWDDKMSYPCSSDEPLLLSDSLDNALIESSASQPQKDTPTPGHAFLTSGHKCGSSSHNTLKNNLY